MGNFMLEVVLYVFAGLMLWAVALFAINIAKRLWFATLVTFGFTKV